MGPRAGRAPPGRIHAPSADVQDRGGFSRAEYERLKAMGAPYTHPLLIDGKLVHVRAISTREIPARKKGERASSAEIIRMLDDPDQPLNLVEVEAIGSTTPAPRSKESSKKGPLGPFSPGRRLLYCSPTITSDGAEADLFVDIVGRSFKHKMEGLFRGMRRDILLVDPSAKKIDTTAETFGHPPPPNVKIPTSVPVVSVGRDRITVEVDGKPQVFEGRRLESRGRKEALEWRISLLVHELEAGVGVVLERKEIWLHHRPELSGPVAERRPIPKKWLVPQKEKAVPGYSATPTPSRPLAELLIETDDEVEGKTVASSWYRYEFNDQWFKVLRGSGQPLMFAASWLDGKLNRKDEPDVRRCEGAPMTFMPDGSGYYTEGLDSVQFNRDVLVAIRAGRAASRGR